MTAGLRPIVRKALDTILEGQTSRFLEAAGEKLPSSFRFNPLKHDLPFQKSLLKREGLEIREAPVPGSHELLPEASGSVGKSLSHFLGHLYIQDLASMLPSLLLDPQPGDRVLDLCAAPGSKSTQLASLMGNRGVLVANDISRKRLRSLVFNLRRCGVANAVVLNLFGEQLGNRYFETFDRVLLDPPCSALGTIHKSPEVLDWWTPDRALKLARNQLNLMQSALKALRPGGVLLYSTCTLTAEENESIVHYALSEFPVELDPLPVPWLTTRPGLLSSPGRTFSKELEKAVRIYPHENACEGFFLAKLRKTESFGISRRRKPPPETVDGPVEAFDLSVRPVLAGLSRKFGIPWEQFARGRYWSMSGLRFVGPEAARFPLYDSPEALGLPLAHTRWEEPKLTTEGSHLLGEHADRLVHELGGAEELEAFVNRRALPATGRKRQEQVLVGFEGRILGHAMIDEGFLQSRFPRAGWIFALRGL